MKTRGNKRNRIEIRWGDRNECVGSEMSWGSRIRLGEVVDVCKRVVGLESS